MAQHTNTYIHWATLGVSLVLPYVGWSIVLRNTNTHATPGQIVVLAGLWAFSIIACRVLLLTYSRLTAYAEPGRAFRSITNYALTACLLVQPVPYIWHALTESLGVSPTVYKMYSDTSWFVITSVAAVILLTFSTYKLLRYLTHKIDQLHKHGHLMAMLFASTVTGLYALRLAWGIGVLWLSLYLVMLSIVMCGCWYILLRPSRDTKGS